MKLDQYLVPFTKINSKQIKNLILKNNILFIWKNIFIISGWGRISLVRKIVINY